MRQKAKLCSLVFASICSTAFALSFVAYPGCVAPPSRHTAPKPNAYTLPDSINRENSRRSDLYHSALQELEKKKKHGELAGLDPAAEGSFSGVWLWYDNQNYFGDHRLRFTFRHSAKRPDKQFEVVYSKGWQLVPLSKN